MEEEPTWEGGEELRGCLVQAPYGCAPVVAGVVSSLDGCTPTGAGVVVLGSLRRRGGGKGRTAVVARWFTPFTDSRSCITRDEHRGAQHMKRRLEQSCASWRVWLVDDREVMAYPVAVTGEVSISSVKHSYDGSYDDR